MQIDTVANVVSSAGVELGLISAPIANPLASTDQNILQLCSLLTRVGRMLVRARPWSHLVKEYTFATVNATESYVLPDDFDRFLHATWWNRTTAWPLGGPLSPSQWQMVKARTAVGTITRPFRARGNLLYLYPTPTSAENVYFEYVSNYWIDSGAAGDVDASSVTLAPSLLWFDEPLLVSGLKLAFLRAKGRDTSYAQEEYDEAYRAAAGGDGAARSIVIAGNSGDWMLSENNLPDTGYGS